MAHLGGSPGCSWGGIGVNLLPVTRVHQVVSLIVDQSSWSSVECVLGRLGLTVNVGDTRAAWKGSNLGGEIHGDQHARRTGTTVMSH